MSYIQQEVDKFLRGEINQQQLKELLDNCIDDIMYDAVYTKDLITKGEINNTL
jgi:hypothetical protein